METNGIAIKKLALGIGVVLAASIVVMLAIGAAISNDTSVQADLSDSPMCLAEMQLLDDVYVTLLDNEAARAQPVSEVDRAQPVSEVDRAQPVSEVDRAQPVSEVDRAQPVSEVDRAQPVSEVDRAQFVSEIDMIPIGEKSDQIPVKKIVGIGILYYSELILISLFFLLGIAIGTFRFIERNSENSLLY